MPAACRTLSLSEKLITLLHRRHLSQDTPSSGSILPSPRTKSGHVEKICEAGFRRCSEATCPTFKPSPVLRPARFRHKRHDCNRKLRVVRKMRGHNTIAMTAKYSPPERKREKSGHLSIRVCAHLAHTRL